MPSITFDESGHILRKSEMETMTEYEPLSLTQQAVNAMEQFKPMIAAVNEYKTLTVAADGFEKVKQTRMQMKRLRLDIEAKRKDLKAGALEYGRTVDNIAKELSAPVIEVEGLLQAQEEEVEAAKERERKAKAEAKAAAIQARVNALQAAGCPVDLAAVSAMSDDDFQWYLTAESKKASEARAEYERLETLRFEEMKRQAEELRIRDEQLAAERAKLEAEREEVRKHQEENRATQQREQQAQRQREYEIEQARLKREREEREEALKPEIDRAETLLKQLQAVSKEWFAANDVAWKDEYIDSFNAFSTQVRWIVRGEA